MLEHFHGSAAQHSPLRHAHLHCVHAQVSGMLRDVQPMGSSKISQRGEQMNLIKILSLIKISIVVCVICLSILFLIISLFLPVFNTADGGIFDGLSVMIIGWMGIMFANLGLRAIGWYANPLLLIVWLGLALSKFRVGGLFALILSIGIALCSFLMVHRTVEVNEAGGTSEIVSIGTGFYVWLASFVICIFGYITTIIFDLINSKKNNAA